MSSTDGVGESVGDGVSVGVGESVGVGVSDGVGEIEGVGVIDGVALGPAGVSPEAPSRLSGR